MPFPAVPPSADDIETLEAMAEELMASFPPEHFPTLNEPKPKEWAQEGHPIAIDVVYNLEEYSPFTEEYIEEGQRICLERATLAGYRLAAILNKLFK